MIADAARAAAPRVAIVTPWFGEHLRGGAEQQAWQLAHQLARRGHDVTVLTTCSAGANEDWGRNALRAGTTRLGPLTVRRFRVAPRDRRAFERVNSILLGLRPSDLHPSVSPIGEDDARIFSEHNISSPSLDAHLVAEGAVYDHVLFLPYLYATTLSGLPIVADRAYLQPCLHDEPYAYLPAVAAVAHAARGLLFNSEGELALASRLFGPGILAKSRVVGEGIDVPSQDAPIPGHVGSFVPSRERYVLYLGRQDAGKNVPMLVGAFGEFRRRQAASPLRLVLAGERPVSYGDVAKGIVDLGPVGEAEKRALLQHARALVQPSTSESFSRVIYESWLASRPVVVHTGCLPTATAVERSGGGFTADTTAAWSAALERIEYTAADELDRMGRLGRSYAETVSAWPSVIARYDEIFASTPIAAAMEPLCVVQTIADGLPHGARYYADALARSLAARGIAVLDDPLGNASPGGLVTIRHMTAKRDAGRWGDAEIVIYHAVDSALRSIDEPAREATARSARDAYAAAPAVRDALAVAGVPAPFLPICVDPRSWDEQPDLSLVGALRDGKQHLLYAGPIIAKDDCDDLLILFLNYLTLEREARLSIVGSGEIDDRVFAHLYTEVRRVEIEDRVLIARELSGPQSQAVFRTADVFISLDRREGYGLELLRAMWFDVPILTAATATSREIAGDSGLLLHDRSDLFAVAVLAQILATDATTRKAVIAKQRLARERFSATASVDAVVASLVERRPTLEPTEAS